MWIRQIVRNEHSAGANPRPIQVISMVSYPIWFAREPFQSKLSDFIKPQAIQPVSKSKDLLSKSPTLFGAIYHLPGVILDGMNCIGRAYV